MNDTPTLTKPSFQLLRNAFGLLVLTTSAGERCEGVVPVRAFPIQSPEDGIALVHTDGHEVAWVERLATLSEPAQALIREELATREFMPEILCIVSVSSFSTPCTWQVQTDRGDTRFVLRGDEDIRRVGATILLVTDSHGIQFLIRDRLSLTKDSQKILDRFL
ncbi:MAG: DUF1854 domain-containing protein [Gammaproteobacteria bacterium]|uniref:cyanophycin metabolism-associated DUF1854 family protein n=1 Tax=Rhodoferax sp. TaxID=50421 RepID=UPI001845E6EE|nr:DUF1854 domain-containing protein [Rhodoferax sp.]MBU3897371.1 DUF1854 domain-containing protein [Gammaproteobacteria bacterium]MBA3058811.1 DUF1854 domain-containing protein [Rhodoferax sp.]MBU3999250.1 DUF1854 domain-containing protein [Gammaproteobacteria bacterium]MBU4018717.1 DUF1854 domain-containing protein [Gammaproteobacteria bacterium]MBU4079672.1 DUF1854 domain-containing protein [Gammaproteobacteria bacterium]